MVLVLELEMSVLRNVNLYFYRTSLQQIGVPKGQMKLLGDGAPWRAVDSPKKRTNGI
jgi:hypothetical protein